MCCTVLRVRIWSAFVESERLRIPGLCEVDSLPEKFRLDFQRLFSSCCSEQHPDTAYWCSFHLREFPPSLPPGHVFMKYFRSRQLIWGLLRVGRSRPHSAKSATSDYEASIFKECRYIYVNLGMSMKVYFLTAH